MSSARPTPPESLFAAFLTRLEAGEALAFEDFVRAHPGQADELRALHEDWREVDALLRCAAPGGMGDLDSARASLAPAADRGEVLSSRELLDLFRAESVAGGRYRFRSVVGRGGMGVVLKVWDRELHRPLAMKAMLPGGRSSDASIAARPLARFLEEAQVTAQLDHPGIVPVHEVGTDVAGRPYFTMKLVEGESFLEVIEHVQARRPGWSLVRAVDILVKVCEALAYAHSRGVVHRDIKPANVMVGRFGEVYLMDWGCARLLSDSSPEAQVSAPSAPRSFRRDLGRNRPDSPLQSRDGDVIGTPAYMPPEQARGRMDLVGVPSDVYALGALLQHLLCGRAPFDEVVDASPYEVWRRVVDGPEPAWHAGARPMPDELVAIARKAMSREPELRYAGAQDLARELRAWLEGRVVGALESGTWAETRKWVGRNRALAGALAATLLVSLASAALFAVQWRQERRLTILANETAVEAERASLRADERAQEAERSNETLRSAAELLSATLQRTDATSLSHHDARVFTAVQLIQQRLDEGALVGFPDARAKLFQAIGALQLAGGDAAGALALSKQGAASLGPGEATDRVDRTRAALLLADSLLSTSQIVEAEATYRSILAREDDVDLVQRAKARSGLGNCLYQSGRFAQALNEFAQVLELFEHAGLAADLAYDTARSDAAQCMAKLGRRDEAVAELQQLVEKTRRAGPGREGALAVFLNNLGVIHLESNPSRPALALSALAEATAIWERELGSTHPTTVLGHYNVGSLELATGNPDRARPELIRALDGWQALDTGDDLQVVRALIQLGDCERQLGQLELAIDLQTRALETCNRILPDGSDLEVDARFALGASHLDAGRPGTAVEVLAEALDVRRRMASGDERMTCKLLVRIGEGLLRTGDAESAADHGSQALEMAVRLGPVALGEQADALALLSRSLRDRADDASRARAGECAQRALDLRRTRPDDPDALALALDNAATTCFALEDLPCAIEHLREAIEVRAASAHGRDAYCSRLQSSLAGCLLLQEAFGEALAILRPEDGPRAAPPTRAEAVVDLYLEARCLEGLGRFDEALELARSARDQMGEALPELDANRARIEALVRALEQRQR